MFKYTIANQADKGIFNKQCKAVEKQFDSIVLVRTITDVDGSTSKFYIYDGKGIVVSNDYYIDAVFIESEIDFNKLEW